MPTATGSPVIGARSRMTPLPGDSTSITDLLVSISNRIWRLRAPRSPACDLPFGDDPVVHVHVDLGQDDLDRHQARPSRTRRRAAATMSSSCGTAAFSSTGLYGSGHVGAAEPRDRRVEKIERVALGDHRRNLGADAHDLDAFVDDQQPVRLAHAGGDRRADRSAGARAGR